MDTPKPGSVLTYRACGLPPGLGPCPCCGRSWTQGGPSVSAYDPNRPAPTLHINEDGQVIDGAELPEPSPSSPSSGSDYTKCVPLPQLLDLRADYRRDHRTVVWTNGCFDLIHLGHLRSLKAASALGDVLIVGLNSDASIRRLKGPSRPIVPAAEHAEMLAALDWVKHIVIFDDLDPTSILEEIQPDIHCKGADYAPPHGKPIPERAVVEAHRGRVEFLPLVPGLSTSELIRRIAEGTQQ